jgi:hypothetical protein
MTGAKTAMNMMTTRKTAEMAPIGFRLENVQIAFQIPPLRRSLTLKASDRIASLLVTICGFLPLS